MRRICVFLGANTGHREAYASVAVELGQELASRRIDLVFGGSRIGLMGILADAVLDHGGCAIGVIPHALVAREVAHTGLTELHVVDSMHERKALMAELADAFVALPGGLGTLDEFFEALTWAQLGLHTKPCALLDVDEYFSGLKSFIDNAVEQGFVRAQHGQMIVTARSVAELFPLLQSYRAPTVPKWIDRRSS